MTAFLDSEDLSNSKLKIKYTRLKDIEILSTLMKNIQLNTTFSANLLIC